MSIEKIFMNQKNSKANASQEVVLNLLQRLNKKSLNNHVTSSKLFHLLYLEEYKTTLKKQ